MIVRLRRLAILIAMVGLVGLSAGCNNGGGGAAPGAGGSGAPAAPSSQPPPATESTSRHAATIAERPASQASFEPEHQGEPPTMRARRRLALLALSALVAACGSPTVSPSGTPGSEPHPSQAGRPTPPAAGAEAWTYATGEARAISFGPDGTAYVFAWTGDAAVAAHRARHRPASRSPAGRWTWAAGIGGLPVVAPDGNVLVLTLSYDDAGVISYAAPSLLSRRDTADGWPFTFPAGDDCEGPVLDATGDAVVVCGSDAGSRIVAIDASGGVAWDTPPTSGSQPALGGADGQPLRRFGDRRRRGCPDPDGQPGRLAVRRGRRRRSSWRRRPAASSGGGTWAPTRTSATAAATPSSRSSGPMARRSTAGRRPSSATPRIRRSARTGPSTSSTPRSICSRTGQTAALRDGWPATVSGKSGSCFGPPTPSVASDGIVFVVTGGAAPDGSISAIGPDGRPLDGWPLAPKTEFAYSCRAARPARLSRTPRSRPARPGVHRDVPRRSQAGTDVVGLDRAGAVLPGWPAHVTAGEARSSSRPDGRLFAVLVNPENSTAATLAYLAGPG